MKQPELNLVHEWNVEPFYKEYPPSENGRPPLNSSKNEACSSGPAVVPRSAEGDRITKIEIMMDQRPDLDWHSK
ncbi:MAG: hypothetical protein ABI162_04035 [Luteolibacter sp.]